LMGEGWMSMEEMQRLAAQVVAELSASTTVSQLASLAAMLLLVLSYLCVLSLLQRREHHVRTGSLKEKSGQQLISPHTGRKVSTHLMYCNSLPQTHTCMLFFLYINHEKILL